ncbi:MAG: adenylate/guanylate cyclase domain-containing protein [Acidimicrobiia bacterium]
MAKLDAKQRAALPDSAFAYVDRRGNRRLPIHDEAHVRNALSRFSQVRFESDQAREQAFRKLLKTSIEYGIAPVGFVAAQMREARAETMTRLPTGPVTFLMSDLQGSTALIGHLGDSYAPLLVEVQNVIRDCVEANGGYEVDARADEFFAVFPGALEGLHTAIGTQLAISERAWPGPVKLRIGLHSGAPARTETGYVGLAVNETSRICSVGHGGQILLSAKVREELGETLPAGVTLRSMGAHQLHGLPHETELFQVESHGLEGEFPPLRLDRSGA